MSPSACSLPGFFGRFHCALVAKQCYVDTYVTKVVDRRQLLTRAASSEVPSHAPDLNPFPLGIDMQDIKAEREFYDTLFTEKPDNEHITFGYDELYELAFPTPPKGLVLDLGCGTGHTPSVSRAAAIRSSVLTSRARRSSARQRLQAEGFTPMTLVADAEHLPFRDSSIDTVWAALLLHHFSGARQAPARDASRRAASHCDVRAEFGNFLTWLAFNVINQVWGLKTTTKNQTSLNPNTVKKVFEPLGFKRFVVTFVIAAGTTAREASRGAPTVRSRAFFLNGFARTSFCSRRNWARDA